VVESITSIVIVLYDLEIINVTSFEDTTAPELMDFFIFPRYGIDSSEGPEEIEFELMVEDEISGFNNLRIYCQSPSNVMWQSDQQVFVHLSSPQNAGDVDFLLTGNVEQYAEAGIWECSVELIDNAGNRINYTENDLDNLGFHSTFEVITDPCDTTPLTLHSLTIEPQIINSIHGQASLTYTLEASDDLSGYGQISFIADSPSQNQWNSQYLNVDSFVEGSDMTYEKDTTFPQYSEYGEWTISYVKLSDQVGNFEFLNEQDLIDQGFPAAILMEGAIPFSGKATIGPEGGIIDPDDDDILKVEIPAGALADETDITIFKIGRFAPVDILVGSIPQEGQTLAEFNFQPDGLNFSLPIIVTLTVDVTDLTQGQRNSLNVFAYIDTNGDNIEDTFVPLSPEDIVSIVTVDGPDGKTFIEFSIQLSHFSTYAIIKPLINPCEGDFDGDYDVDGSDLATFAADFGRTNCSGDCEGDFDSDSDVDGSDLATFAADFGRTDCP